MIDATAIILTKNEEKNIVKCLESMKGFAKRCVVVDSGSTDNTVKLARQCGADVYFNEFEYYAQQFNWGIDNTDIDTEWIIRLDADEVFPNELCREIEDIIKRNQNTNMNGIILQAHLYFMGKMLRHGVRTKRKMMLFKKKYGRIEDRRRDAHSIISEGTTEHARNMFIHYDYKDIDSFIRRYNWYATREMQDYVDFTKGKDIKISGDKIIEKQRKKKFGIYYKAPKYIRAVFWFLYNYIWRLGFLDGKAGFLFLFLDNFWYRTIVDAKIDEYLQKGGEFEKLSAFEG